MTRNQAAVASPGGPAAPAWLASDMVRIEEILLETAGASAHPLVSGPSLHLITAGGKRLRPALVLLASHAGESGRRSTDLAAAAVELIHLATLYHDDIIDETGTRRGVETTHAKWGTHIAILAGDYLFASGCSLGAEAGGEVPLILAGALAEVCEGQIVETASTGDSERSVTDYLTTIELKTASLFRAACDMGACTAEAPNDRRAALVEYGQALGIAFQMVDDLIDLVGDPGVTGKTPGTDLKEGVYTLPVLIASERDPELASRLRSTPHTLEDVMPMLESSGALDEAIAHAARYAAAAGAAVQSLPEEPWKQALSEMASTVLAQIKSI